MAVNFKVKKSRNFEGFAEIFKPSDQLKDRGTVVRKVKSISGLWHSLQIGYVETPNVYPIHDLYLVLTPKKTFKNRLQNHPNWPKKW